MNGELFPQTPDTAEEVEKLKANVEALLDKVGYLGKCRGCDAEIYWVIHTNKRRTPYDRDATNHFVTCPKAVEFKRKNCKGYTR